MPHSEGDGWGRPRGDSTTRLVHSLERLNLPHGWQPPSDEWIQRHRHGDSDVWQTPLDIRCTSLDYEEFRSRLEVIPTEYWRVNLPIFRHHNTMRTSASPYGGEWEPEDVQRWRNAVLDDEKLDYAKFPPLPPDRLAELGRGDNALSIDSVVENARVRWGPERAVAHISRTRACFNAPVSKFLKKQWNR